MYSSKCTRVLEYSSTRVLVQPFIDTCVKFIGIDKRTVAPSSIINIDIAIIDVHNVIHDIIVIDNQYKVGTWTTAKPKTKTFYR